MRNIFRNSNPLSTKLHFFSGNVFDVAQYLVFDKMILLECPGNASQWSL